MDDNSRPPLAERPKIKLAPELPTISSEAQDEKDNSEYQILWSNTMDEGKYKSSSSYTNANVLLLCWSERSDDLRVKDEVIRLKNTFETRFNYDAEIAYLEATASRKLQVQVNTIVQRFIDAHDSPTTLLIVYYAGHGKPGNYYGSLVLHGPTSENDQRRSVDSLVWNRTEKLLEDAEGDVLEIFDCCYAGNLLLTRGDYRLFEFLAAASEMATTPIPGRESFTSALIFALESLVEEQGRFTTVELRNKIKNDAPKFPKDQNPVLSSRKKNGSNSGRIMLHPLEKAQRIQENGSALSLGEDTELDIFKRQTVTLHFDFCDKPSHAVVKAFGQQLNQLFETDNLGVNRVRWGGMKQSAAGRAFGILQRSLHRHRRASMEQPHAASDAGGSQSGSNGDDSTFLTPSPSPSNGDSPRPLEFTAAGNIAVSPSTLAPILTAVSLGVKLESQGQIEDSSLQ